MNEPFEIEGREVFIGASIGIAIGGRRRRRPAAQRRPRPLPSQGQGPRPKAGLRAADARRDGRAHRARGCAGRRRCASSELVLHYQPIFELATERLVGAEALIRWEHPTRGLLLPGEFIPVAEDSRLMAPLGRWVLAEACMQAARWRRDYALRLRADDDRQLLQRPVRRPDDGRRRRARCSPSPTSTPERLVIELTETAFLRDPETVAERMRELKQLGVRLAVDDFGTGNASLRHLGALPGRRAQGRPLVRRRGSASTRARRRSRARSSASAQTSA